MGPAVGCLRPLTGRPATSLMFGLPFTQPPHIVTNEAGYQCHTIAFPISKHRQAISKLTFPHPLSIADRGDNVTLLHGTKVRLLSVQRIR